MAEIKNTNQEASPQAEIQDGSPKRLPEASRPPRREIKYEEWYAEGLRRFGDTSKWEFKCSKCGNVQTMADFEGLVKDPANVVHFSCLGRWKKGVGCDWTLGGLFRIHTLTVDRAGEKCPVFEFSGEPVGLGGGVAVAVPTSPSPSNPLPQRED